MQYISKREKTVTCLFLCYITHGGISMNRPKVSLCIITLNEEQNIARCIKSVPWADEVIVLDSGSTDQTQQIAKSLGAKCYQEEWKGFTIMKNRCAELAQFEWILSLDADEALSQELCDEILSTMKNKDFVGNYEAIRFPRISHHLGRWIKHGGWYPDYQTRLYNKSKVQWVGGVLHEHISAKKIKTAKNNLMHWVFKDLDHQISTNNRYSTLGAQALIHKGKKFSYLKLLIKPWSKFVETYIFKLGFLDGFAGFVISVGAAYSMFLKFSKLYYMEKEQKFHK